MTEISKAEFSTDFLNRHRTELKTTLYPFKTPARETDRGHMPPEFNVDQQNFLEEKQRGKNWGWSAIRPSVVGGNPVSNFLLNPAPSSTPPTLPSHTHSPDSTQQISDSS